MTTQSKPPRVLVVDDDGDTADTLSRLLCLEGISAECCLTASDALARADGFDVVVTDIRLGDQDGLELCRTICAQMPHVVVIVVSGAAGQLQGAMAAGAQAFVEKPADYRALARRIHALV